MKLLRFIFWPLIMLKNILDHNGWSEKIINKTNIRVKVWERGCGPTLACGTGACACLAVCSKIGLTNKQANVHLPGGRLNITWPNENSSIIMKGPSKHVFNGSFNTRDYQF